MSSTIQLFKVITSIIILASGLIGNSLVICVRSQSWISRLEALTGGVFLGAGLAHLLDDSMRSLIDYSYPIAASIACGMFSLLTIVKIFSSKLHEDQSSDESLEEAINGEANSDESNLQSLAHGRIAQAALPSLFGDNTKLGASSFSLYAVMCVHSALEGLALGIIQEWTSLLAIFCAILGHKPIESFALSLMMVKDKPTKCLFWVLCVIYSLMTPAGIVFSLMLSEIGNKILEGAVSALSAGTFLYATAEEWSEMMEKREQWNTKEKFCHVFMFILGLIWMLLISLIDLYK